MTKAYTKIDKAATREIGAGVVDALQAFAAEHGLTVAGAGGRYDPAAGKVTLKVEFSLASVDSGQIEWDRYCSRYGLTPADYGRAFQWGGDTYVVRAFRPRAPKRPISATAPDGRTFSFPLDAVKRLLQEHVA